MANGIVARKKHRICGTRKKMQVYLNDKLQITPQVKNVVLENFKLLDTDQDGKLNHAEIGVLFRALGQNPTDEDLQDMLYECHSSLLGINEYKFACLDLDLLCRKMLSSSRTTRKIG